MQHRNSRTRPRRAAARGQWRARGVVAVVVSIAVQVAPAGRAVADSDLAGKTVYLDPGHSGLYDSSLTQQVPNGRGGTKECQTSGTSTADGYPEHTFNWDVVERVNVALTKRGARTVLSRTDDNSLGPCVDQRAATGNSVQPDAVVSIHADGGPQQGHGFHVNYSAPPLNDSQAGPSTRLAIVMRDQLIAAGMQPSTYIGSEGLYGRADLAGLSLATYPAILIELGNMKNPSDAAQMTDPSGRERYAAAVVQGIAAYLNQATR